MKKIISSLIMSACLVIGLNAYAAMPSNWKLSGSNYADKCVIKHEKTETYEGNGALYIKWDSGYVANTYAHILCRSFSLETGKTYRLGFYAKTVSGERMFAKWAWDWTDIYRASAEAGLEAEEWTYYSQDFTPKTSGAWMGLFIDSKCEYYMDNVTLYELDENGEPVGENIMINGDFESGDFIPCGDVSNVSTKPLDSSVLLSWDNPTDSDFSYVNVYAVNEETGEETFAVSAIPESGETRSSVIVGDLENDKLYTFRLYAVDTGDNLSGGVSTFGLPVVDRYYADDVKVKRTDNGKEISAITSGALEVFTNVTNNTYDEGLTAILISTLYKDGKLVTAVSDKQDIAVGESADLSAQITVPEGEGYELCSYIWNGQGKILAKSIVLK